MTLGMLKWGKRGALALGSVLLLIAALIIGALVTPLGLKGVLAITEHFVPQFKVEQSQGALLTGFTLSGVEYQDDTLGIELAAESVGLSLRAACFTEPAICVNQFAIKGLHFSMPELPVSEASQTEDVKARSARITAPLPIRVQGILLDDISLEVLGNKVHWQSFSTGFQFQGNRIRLAKTRWQGINVELAPSSESKSEPQASASESTTNDIVLPEVMLPLAIELTRLDVHNFELKSETPVEVHHLGLEASAVGNNVNLKRFEIDMPQMKGDLYGQVQLAGDYPLSLSLNAEVLSQPVTGQQVSLNLEGSAAQLKIKARLSERIESEIRGEVSPLSKTLPFNIVLQNTRLQWPLSGESDYQADIASFAAKGSLDGYQMDLSGKVDGKSIPETLLYLAGRGDLSHVQLTELDLETLGGELSAQASVNWEAPLNWSASMRMKDIQPGLHWPEAEGRLSGHLQTQGQLTEEGGWQIALPVLDIEGVIRDYPLHLEGMIQASDPKGNGEIQFLTDALTLAHGPNGLSVKGALTKELDMHLELRLEDLSKSIPDLNGRVKGVVDVTGSLTSPQAGVALRAENLKWQDQVSVINAEVNGEITPLPEPSGRLKVTVTEAVVADNHINSVTLDLSGKQAQHTLLLDVISDLVSTSLAVQGDLALDPDVSWNGQLGRMSLTTEQGTWMLDSPTKVGFEQASQQVSIDAHCWRQKQSSLCLDKATSAGKSGKAELSLNQFDFTQVSAFTPPSMALDGGADIKVKASWSTDAPPSVEANVSLKPGRFILGENEETSLEIGWQDSAVNAHLSNHALSADWMLDVDNNGDLFGEFTLNDVLSEKREILGKATLSTFNLDFLAPLLGEYSKLAANLHSELHFSGPLMHPKVSGHFAAEDILIKGDLSPVQVTNGKLELALGGYLADLNANLITPDGELLVSGDADWEDLTAWRSHLRVHAEELKVEVPPMVKIKVVPDMNIALSPKQAKVEGNIALPWGRVVVEALPPSAISVSKDQVVLDANMQPIEGRNEIPFNVESNINITIGDDFKLSAFGLEGGLKGKLNVTQKNKGPFILGEINIVDGSYRSFGQDLIISEGKILMNGPPDQPYVAITAIRNPDNTQDDVTAGVKVTGSADQPTLTIFSEPAMPQANALSYLLRGQDIDGETGGNAMTTTLIGLSLAKSGQVVGEIGEAFGVQDLQLDTAGSGDDSQVTVSGYVFPGLQVKYGVGIFDSVGEFTVRYRLMQDLYVEAISGLDSAVDLLYQFEFN